MKQLVINRSLNTQLISLWTRLCILGLFYVFVHYTVILPIIEFQKVETTITNNVESSENEVETEELDDLVEHTIDNLLPLMIVQNNTLSELSVNTENDLHYKLFGPPPEFI